jgi:serine/threonine protein kinase
MGCLSKAKIRVPDVKPDNIMVDYHHVGQKAVIKRIQLTDLENAAYLPIGRCIRGMLAGNDNWRSPEGHLKGELNRPSDMYSFGAVVSFGFANIRNQKTPKAYNDSFSASTPCLEKSSSARTPTCRNTKCKAYFLILFGYSVRFRSSGTKTD